MAKALEKENNEEIWDAYVVVSHWMAADLGLYESFSINETLMNPVKRILKHLRRKGVITSLHGHKYVGEFKDSLLDGQGTLSYASGHKYVGEFKEDLREGQGTMTYPSGHSYVGEFKDDLRDGQGTMTFPDSRKYVGEWKGNVRNGQGTVYGADGTILQSGIWKNDVFVSDDRSKLHSSKTGP